MDKELDAKWDELAEEVMSGMKEWRLQHPKATLRQIEQALDEPWRPPANHPWRRMSFGRARFEPPPRTLRKPLHHTLTDHKRQGEPVPGPVYGRPAGA